MAIVPIFQKERDQSGFTTQYKALSTCEALGLTLSIGLGAAAAGGGGE